MNKGSFLEYNETEQYILNKLEFSRLSMDESLEKINSIERSIKRIDPNFKFNNYRPCVGDYLRKYNYFPKK